MKLHLEGRKALVTGASAGIGAAIARTLAAEGVNLVLVARTASNLERARDLLLAQGAAVEIVVEPCDVSHSADIDALAARHGDIDLLVNNAGAVPGGSIFVVDEEAWRTGWDSKVFAYVNMTRRFYPLLKARGAGVIVNVLGTGSFRKDFDYVCGGMGNAALDFFTQCMGAHSPVDGIRILGVSPGSVDTERLAKVTRVREQAGLPPRKRPFGRAATPQEIADMVAFLASDRCAYVSGSIHVVDAGASVSRT